MNTLSKYLADCGLLNNTKENRRSLYSLRHTFDTHESQKGRSIYLLAKEMETSVTMIEKHCSHQILSLSADVLSGKYWMNFIK